MVVFYVLIALFVFDFVLGRTLSLLNASWSNKPVPEILKDIFTPEKRAKQQAYEKAGRKTSWIYNSVSLIFTLCMLCLGGYKWVDEMVHYATLNLTLWDTVWRAILMAVLFMVVIDVMELIIDLPFKVYSTFVIRQRYGLNRTTPGLFVVDLLKSFGLNLVMTCLLLGATVSIYYYLPDWFWLIAWAVMMLFSLFMSYFYSQLIVPIFNKQTPLQEGELKDKIEALAKKNGFPLTGIYVMDSSKRAAEGNAYFTGFGKKKRIVLYDTLMEQVSTDEIVAILAHEIGHWKHHDTIKRMGRGLVESLLKFGLLGLVLKYNLCSNALGCEPSFHVNFYFFYTLYAPISMLIGLAGNHWTRKHEYAADEFAKSNGLAEELISSLKKLTGNALSNPTPHPAFVFFRYSHPTLVQRAAHLEPYERKKKEETNNQQL